MIPTHTRISEPLLFSLLKAFYSFFLISLYLDDNYICILIRIELHNSLTFLWPPGRTGTTPSSWSYLPRGNSGTYLKSCPLLRALPRKHPYPWWTLWSPLSLRSFTAPVFIPSWQLLQFLLTSLWGFKLYIIPHWISSVYCGA